VRVILTDGDIICYRCAASCEPTKKEPDKKEEGFVALGRANDILNRIGDRCQVEEHRIYLSGVDNFRYKLYPDYKAHRRVVPKPPHLEWVRNYLVKKWGAIVVHGMEADDAIGIAAKRHFIVASIDKDLKQISGEHYNFVKDEFEVVSEEQASYNLYAQMLTGDSSDGVKGIQGIGPVNAKRILEGLSRENMHLTVMEYYDDPDRFLLNLRLLSVLRTQDEYQRILGEIDEEKRMYRQEEESQESVSSREDTLPKVQGNMDT